MYSKKQIEKNFNEICRLISEEGLSQRKALERNGKPNKETFYKWLDSDEKKIEQYARAREERADWFADDILEIADEQNADGYVDDEGRAIIDGTAIQRSKLKVDTRKRLMSKMQPRKYGDKNTTVLEGGEKPIEISFED